MHLFVLIGSEKFTLKIWMMTLNHRRVWFKLNWLASIFLIIQLIFAWRFFLMVQLLNKCYDLAKFFVVLLNKVRWLLWISSLFFKCLFTRLNKVKCDNQKILKSFILLLHILSLLQKQKNKLQFHWLNIKTKSLNLWISNILFGHFFFEIVFLLHYFNEN